MESERQVQYEFKVIVRVGEDAWPEEVRAWVDAQLDQGKIWITGTKMSTISTVAVERIRDGY